MKIIGIIGGGQLGMFLAMAAYEMGYETAIYDSNEECSARGVATYFYQGSFDDYDKLEEFSKKCDLITYEFENVNSDIIDRLAKIYPIVQGALPLIIASSRSNEKQMANDLNIMQPSFEIIKNQEQLNNIQLAYPYILKSNTLGYDGKGQIVVNNKDDLINADINKTEYLAESKIAFDYEISVIGVQSLSGELKLYEPFYNIHSNGILHLTLINKDIPENVIKQANKAIEKIMKHNNIYGLLCCEFFVKDDIVYFNEMAPRPHNSGHITMNTHVISQYENHLRALLDLKLGSTNIKSDAFMVNVLGQDVDKIDFSKYECIKYYDYHKQPRHNRKVGHLIVSDMSYLEYFKTEWR